MGTTNSIGVYEYDITDGNIGPVMLNLQSAALTTLLTNNAFYLRADSQAEQDALLTEFGAPLFIFRTDVEAGLNLRYTLNGTDWFIQDFRQTEWTNITLASGYKSPTGYTAQYRRKYGMIEYRGRITNDADSLTSGSYNVGSVPAGFRPDRQELRSVPVGGSSSSGRAWTETSGTVNISTPVTATYVDISQLSYYL